MKTFTVTILTNRHFYAVSYIAMQINEHAYALLNFLLINHILNYSMC